MFRYKYPLKLTPDVTSWTGTQISGVRLVFRI